MSQLDRAGLISQSNFLFPDNTTAEITPSDIRQFNNDLADSLALTGSNVISASYALTASYAENVVDPTWDNIQDKPSGLVSGSSQVNLTDTTFVDGTEFMVLRTDGNGNLSFDYADRAQIEIRALETIVKGDPLYVAGFSDGENRVTVRKADASDPSKMPAYGVAYESVSQNTNTQMVALGTLQDIDTQTPNFNVGDVLYVASGGGLTNVRPEGTNLVQNVGIVGRRQQNSGEIVVSAIGRSNDVPNLPTGFAWVGNGSQVATAVATSSFAGAVPVGVATTGSNDFFGDQTITSTSSTALTITSGVGDQSPVTIEGGVNLPNKFTDSAIRGVVDLEATNLISTALTTSSLHIGEDSSVADTVSIINKSGAGIVGIGFSDFNTLSNKYSVLAGTITGTTNLRGETINLLPSSSASTTVNITGDVSASGDITASAVRTDFLEPIGGAVEMLEGNFVVGNGAVEAVEVVGGTGLFDTLQPNSLSRIQINTSTEVTASNASTSAFKVWDGSYTEGGNPSPILTINSANERAGSQEAMVLKGGAFFAPRLFAEPADADTYPLEITDGLEPRITVYSQNDAAASRTNIELNGHTVIGGQGKDVTIETPVDGNDSGSITISGHRVSIQANTGVQFNSALTINGALLINSAIYQGNNTVSFPSSSFDNLNDYFQTQTTNSPTRLNVDSVISGGRTINLLVAQGFTSGSLELQYSGGPSGTYKLFGPAGSVSGSFLTPHPESGSYSYYVIKAVNLPSSGPAGVGQSLVVSSYVPNLDYGDITQWI